MATLSQNSSECIIQLAADRAIRIWPERVQERVPEREISLKMDMDMGM
jgi:hypothetical protein